MVGALWDAYAEIAVYIEVLRVEAGLPAPPNSKGGVWRLCFYGLGVLYYFQGSKACFMLVAALEAVQASPCPCTD